MQIIYIDVLFIMNLVMDCYIFFIASLLLGTQIVIKRIFVASLLASCLYCLTIILPILQKLPLNLYYFMLPVLPIIYLFNPSDLKKFTKIYLVNLLSAMVIGGVSFSLYYQLGFIIPNITWVMPLLSGFIMALIIFLSFNWIRKKVLLLSCEAQISFRVDGRRVCLTGIVDTGNALYTIFSKRPVVVVSLAKIERYIKKDTLRLVEALEIFGVGEEVLSQKASNIELIPFESVGCTSGMLVGIEVEEMRIMRGEHIYKHRKGVVGLSVSPVFKEENYCVLIHPDLVR